MFYLEKYINIIYRLFDSISLRVKLILKKVSSIFY